MIARSDIAAGKVSQAYRAAKLALLRIQAHQTIERTDASVQRVVEALARVAESMNDQPGVPPTSP
jgi:hypothetical protein